MKPFRQTYVVDRKARRKAAKEIEELMKNPGPDDTENLPEMPEDGGTVAIFFQSKDDRTPED